MAANSLFLVISVVSFIGSLAFHTACVRWGLRWAKVADTSYWKALGILFLFVIAGVVGASIAGAVLFGLSVAASDRAIDVVSYVGQVIASCFVIVLLMKVRLWRAALAVIPYNAATLAAMAIVVYVIRPYGYEAFSIPTNAMAPTILGVHVKAPCPRCGQPAYGPPLEPRQSLPLEGLLMNCSAEHRAVFVKDVPQKVLAGDRILSCKFISPRR